MLDWPPWLLVLGALAVAQIGLLLAARLLDRRVRRTEAALAWVLVLALLAPWLGGEQLLAPMGSLARIGQLPLESAAIAALPEGQDPWAVQSDAVLAFLPLELEVRRALRAGRLPLWSDRIGGGNSLWANPQAEVFSPVAMVARFAPLQFHLLVALAVKLLVAIQGACLLARVLGARRQAALLAGLGFGLGGGMIAWAMFPLASEAAWIPWHAVAVIGLVRRRGPLGIEVLRAAGATLVLLVAGHPETGLGGGLLTATLALAVVRRGEVSRRIGAAAVAALLGLALAAPVVLPTLHGVVQSQRYVDKTTTPVSDELFHNAGQLLFRTLVNPLAAGRPYQEPFAGRYNWCEGLVPYAGVVAWVGLVAALLVGGRLARVTAAFSLFSLFAASGFRPLALILHALPGLELVTWERVMLAGALATALAGSLAAGAVWGRVRLRGAVALVIAAGLSLLVRADTELWWMWGGLAAAAVVAWIGGRPGRRLALPAVVVIAAIDLLWWASPQLPQSAPSWFYPRTEVIDLIAAAAAKQTPSRVVGEGFALYPNHLAVHGFEDLRGHDPLSRADQQRVLGSVFDFAPSSEQYFAPFLRVDHPLLDALNVSTVISHHRGERGGGLVRAGAGSAHFVWSNPDALARWFFPAAVEVVEPRSLPQWLRDLDDPRHVAVPPAAAELMEGLGSSVGRVRSEGERRPGRERLLVDPAPERRLLATSIPWPEGWSARGDGTSLRTVVVNGAFLGVELPPNTSRVDMRFVPPGLRLGLMVSVLGWMMVGGIWWRRSR